MSVSSSSNSSLRFTLDKCFHSTTGIINYTAIIIIFIPFFQPLFIFVLYVGYKRWRKQRFVVVTATTSYSDIFTFNMVALEMIGAFGSFSYCYGIYTNHATATKVAMSVFFIISPGQTLFHLLTCVERYLAVVHPVTYVRLRQSGGIRIRNIIIVFVWLFCIGSAVLSMISDYFYDIGSFSLWGVSIIVVSFCSLSVLRVLIRPGPGEVGGNRGRVDKSKQRAFYTITIIMGALLFRLFGTVGSTAANYSPMLSDGEKCVVMMAGIWFSLPSSLVLPLLFLQRAGKLPGCKHNAESG